MVMIGRRGFCTPVLSFKPEDVSAYPVLYTSGFGDVATSSGAQNLHVKSTILTNDLIEESPSPLAFDRKRAKSYPSERPSEPIPLLELPQQPQLIEEEENEVSLLTQYIG